MSKKPDFLNLPKSNVNYYGYRGDVSRRVPSKPDIKFLKAVGFGKDEAEWITQYDSWPLRGGFRNEYTLVGRGGVTNSECGKHRWFEKCVASPALHGGKDVWHNCVKSCGRPSCSRCFKYGWAVREANNIDSRFLTADDVLGFPYGSVEHVQASVPKCSYGLSYEALCMRAILAFKASGVPSGCTLFHGFRKDKVARELFFSPHFHALGYVNPLGGGYKCRGCPHLQCSSRMRLYCDFKGLCDGFEQVTRRAHVDDGWIVSLAKNEKGVVEKRDSVFGTAWYQLEHASYKVGVVRFQIVKWFGDVNNRKLKTVHRPFKHSCLVCGGSMERDLLPLGVSVVSNRGEKGFMKNFMLEHVDGEDV